NLAFVTPQFLQAHVRVWCDGEHQGVHRRFTGEVVAVGLVANRRVLLETPENERAAADRLAVELFRSASLEQLVGIFSGVDRCETHAQGRKKSRVRMVKGEAHSQ